MLAGCVDKRRQEKISSRPNLDEINKELDSQSTQKVVIAGSPHQTAHLPFDWSIYEDPSRPEFWADGADGVLPRPFLYLAGEPTVENAKRLIAWQKLQWQTIEEIIKSLGGASELKKYSELLGVNVLEEVAKKDPLKSFSKPSLDLAKLEEKTPESFRWQDVGIVYVYSSLCSACKKQQPVINNLITLGARIIPLQVGKGEPLFVNSMPYKKGEWQSFFPLGEEIATPTMFIVYRGKSPKKHIGFISLSDLKREITHIKGDDHES